MIRLLLIIAAIMLCIFATSCSTTRNGCNEVRGPQKHDKKPFRAQLGGDKVPYLIIRVDTTSNPKLIVLRRFNTIKVAECYCPKLPDSIRRGNIVYLPRDNIKTYKSLTH